MKTLKRLFDKTLRTISSEGIDRLILKIFIYIDKRLRPSNYFNIISEVLPNKRFVLFVSGEPKNSTSFYRCEIPREQLASKGKEGDIVYYKYLTEKMLDNYEHIIWYRLPLTLEIEGYVQKLKSVGRKIIYSIDDLLFDKESILSKEWVDDLHKDDREKLLRESEQILKFLQISDLGISSTTTLANEMKKYIKGEVMVLKNGYSNEQFEISKKLEASWPGIMNLGFFSGSETHDKDFSLIVPSLINLFEKYSDLKLHLGGYIDIPEELTKFKDRIIKYPLLNNVEYLKTLAKCSLILCPLEENLHNECKSEVRFVQAGLSSRAVIATKTLPFSETIKNLENGITVEHNLNWEAILGQLINDEENVMKMGKNAYEKIKIDYNTNKLGEKIILFLETNGRRK